LEHLAKKHSTIKISADKLVLLGPMTVCRYRMQRDLEGRRGPRGLGIEVFKFRTGKPRPTTTLSGGETFIAVLALALGLADIVESVSGK
jgi:exonuclease SbcC